MTDSTTGYTKLAAVPDLMGEYRAALGGMVPGLGALTKGSGSGSGSSGPGSRPGQDAGSGVGPRSAAWAGSDSASGSGSGDGAGTEVGAGARAIPAERFEVHGVVPDTAHLAEYCRTTGLRFGEELPATYPYVLAFPLAIKVMNSKGFPFGAVGVVHLTNSIEQTRPLHVGEALNIRVRAENPRAHRAGMLIDMVTEITVPAEGDEVVWRQVSGFLGKGAKTEGLPAAADSAVKAAGEPAANPAFVRVTQDSISAYAEASGDKNPIHVSKLGAKAFGFPTTIAHGMWSAAAMLAGMEGLVPRSARFTVEFGKPVRLPSKVAFTADRDEAGAGAGAGSAGGSTAVSATGSGAAGAGWELQLRSAKKPEVIHAVGRLEPLS